jgi:hypothetical protein
MNFNNFKKISKIDRNSRHFLSLSPYKAVRGQKTSVRKEKSGRGCLIMDTRYLAAKLSKEQCLTFLKDILPQNVHQEKKVLVKKPQLIEMLLERITVQKEEMERLLTMFPYELAVEPVELSQLLMCSRSERQRWVKEGRIPVLEYRTFRVAGRDQLFPVFDRRQVLLISPADIVCWRAMHQQEVQENKQIGAQQAVESRKSNTLVRKQFMLSWAETVQAWQEIAPPELVAVLQLCYWTVLASRWAKENQLRALRSTKLGAIYKARKEAWYVRKNEAMRLLAVTPHALLSFYRPLDADKRHLWLCEKHYEEKCESSYESVWDFFADSSSEIKSCSRCSVHEEKDYYALYYLEVRSQLLPDLCFSFHMPYPVGTSFFPQPETLPKVQHIEQDGLFRFGRSLLDEEKILHRENDVQLSFEKVLQEAKTWYSFVSPPHQKPDVLASQVSSGSEI